MERVYYVVDFCISCEINVHGSHSYIVVRNISQLWKVVAVPSVSTGAQIT